MPAAARASRPDWGPHSAAEGSALSSPGSISKAPTSDSTGNTGALHVHLLPPPGPDPRPQEVEFLTTWVYSAGFPEADCGHGMYAGCHPQFFYFTIIWGDETKEGIWQSLWYERKRVYIRNVEMLKVNQLGAISNFLRVNCKIKMSLKFNEIACNIPKFIWEKLASKLDVLFET